MALAALGYFVFHTATIPFQQFGRSQSWHHPNQAIVGGSLPPSQYTGKDPDEITIKAELRPEVSGGDLDIEVLREMADTGQPWPLILGSGRLLGSFVITKIQDDQEQLMFNGKARSISFSMTLKKVAEHARSIEGDALALAVGMVNRLTGI